MKKSLILTLTLLLLAGCIGASAQAGSFRVSVPRRVPASKGATFSCSVIKTVGRRLSWMDCFPGSFRVQLPTNVSAELGQAYSCEVTKVIGHGVYRWMDCYIPGPPVSPTPTASVTPTRTPPPVATETQTPNPSPTSGPYPEPTIVNSTPTPYPGP